MSWLHYRSATNAHFRHIALALLFQQWLVHLSHGVHLTNTMSFTAIDLAKSAGMDDDDISAAIPVTQEDLLEGAVAGAMGDSRKNRQDSNVPSILDVVKSSSSPILPLCCSMEPEDTPYLQCEGSVVSRESLGGPPSGFKRRWTAPAKLVSTSESTTFKLEKSALSCQYATFAASMSLDGNSSETHHFYPDGNLKFENEFYMINEYCISSIRKDKIFLQICQANCTDPTTPCIHKCCGLDEVYSFGNDDYPTGCQPITRDFGGSDSSSTSGERYDKPLIKWSPILYHDLSARLSNKELAQLHPHYILKYPSSFKQKCQSKKTTVFPFGSQVSDYLSMVTGKPFKNLQFRMRKDGWLLYPFRDSKGHEIPVVNRILNYCVDGAQLFGETTEYSNQESQSVLFLCSGGVDEAYEIDIDNDLSSATLPHLPTPINMTSTATATTSTEANSTSVPVFPITTTSSSSSSLSSSDPSSTTTTMRTRAFRGRTFSPRTSTSSSPNKLTLLQERKVPVSLYRSSRNKNYYNRVMSYSLSNVTSSTTTTTSTRKPRFRKRSRHYIFYKPITVHDRLLKEQFFTEEATTEVGAEADL